MKSQWADLIAQNRYLHSTNAPIVGKFLVYEFHFILNLPSPIVIIVEACMTIVG